MRKNILIAAALAPWICPSALAAPKPIKAPGADVILSAEPASRLYGGVEYLLWWVKGAPLSVPLVSSGPGSQGADGAILSASNAVVLYGAPYPGLSGGNDTQNYPAFSGTRLTLGYWLDDKQGFGIELRGFMLENQVAGYQVRSGRIPVVSIPVNGIVPYTAGGGPLTKPAKGEDGLPLAIPGALSGGVKVTNSLLLWGADLTGIINISRTDSWELSGLVGFRHVNLSEKLNLSADLTGIGSSDEGFSYLGQSGIVSDSFQTRNQFYGVDLGLRGTYSDGPLSVEIAGRVALGVNHGEVDVSGGYRAVGSPFGTSGNEGIFAQPANEGRTSSNKFSAVPEAMLKVGYAITPRLKATISYDFLYYTNVVRPGDQINRNLPKGQVFNQGLAPASTTSPSRLFKTSDFYAQGVSFGLEFKF